MSLESYFANLRIASGCEAITLTNDNARTSSPRMMTRKAAVSSSASPSDATSKPQQEVNRHPFDGKTLASSPATTMVVKSSSLSKHHSILSSPRPHHDAIFHGIVADVLQQHRSELLATAPDLDDAVDVRSPTFLEDCLDEVEAILEGFSNEDAVTASRSTTATTIPANSCLVGQ
mmetsp:Transcript_119150/g.178018  ORF Transcript_119150/g.178018 Transcript_119150/m.178018 type:complete len:175 (+) Transcript_119150:63-587(+)|eukprot:CAMPEP_0117008674 /NCGR_PEP_ID=MMETSP0472-20121206/8101_1 /TAXON_ID=693140 ORGANISM="Tiarina fusus, Strain LIS" /NCGR_SAMPLE_ID=MMETSP0472 /ASSEMBLY_ACC=CAM_ASM_000603 /LENGTH=174 /DNA_ID=CAMNT_0004710773 /DNA_START=57 /DNA_END=581 /DNA_ORIENTATION=-